jgi:RHS repeat-associated protein
VFLYYVHADHLNTPRLVTDTANNVRWRWDSDAFGKSVPNGNPAGLGAFEYNLRFPGQQYDALAGLHYNYFRDLDPATSKYTRSDPVGLLGGTNTYTYARGAPISLYDSLGLDVDIIINNNAPVTGTHAGLFINTQGRILYDPGGSYRTDIKGSFNVLDGVDANLPDYVNFQKKDGKRVEVFHFPLTREQDRKILENIENHKYCGAFECSYCVSEVLDGVGPFRNLGVHRFPNDLAGHLRRLLGTPPSDLSSPFLESPTY